MCPKVLIVFNRLNIGGLVPQVLYTAQYLQDAFEVRLVCGALEEGEAGFDSLLKETGLTLEIVPNMQRAIHPFRDFKALQYLRKYIRDFRPDVVHTHAAKSGALGRLAAYLEKVPVIFHTFHGHVFHSYFSPAKTRLFLETERWLAQKSSAIVTISRLQKKDIEAFKVCEGERIRVIHCGYDLKKFVENSEEKRKAFRTHWKVGEAVVAIGMVGRLASIKNNALLLKAMKKVKAQTDISFQIFLVGDGEERANLENLAKELNLSFDHQPNDACDLIFTSWRTDVVPVYAGLDLACLTSLNEGTPISLIEAQAAGLPIVSTDVGGVRDTVLVNENVLLSPSEEVESLVENILKMLFNIKNGTLKGEANRDFVFKKFGLERMVEETKNLYWEKLEVETRDG